MRWAMPLAQMMRASAASLRGDAASAAASLRSAVDGFDRAGMKLYAAAARWRLGAILGGDEGSALIETARGYMGSQGVKVPQKMLDLLAPGM